DLGPRVDEEQPLTCHEGLSAANEGVGSNVASRVPWHRVRMRCATGAAHREPTASPCASSAAPLRFKRSALALRAKRLTLDTGAGIRSPERSSVDRIRL